MTSLDGKRAQREQARRLRDRIEPEARAAGSLRACQHLIDTLAFSEAKRLSSFASIGSEIDASTLERTALERGLSVYYPRVVGKRLCFAECTRADLVPGPFGLSEPSADAPVRPLAEIDLVLVPGLLFDPDSGHRIGYGGGYYDRALAELSSLDDSARPLIVGFAFWVQCTASIAAEPYDVPVEAIVHEDGILSRSERARRRLRPARSFPPAT